MEPDDTDNSPVSDKQTADFFISYTQADRRWAEWIAWQLQGTYRVIIQAWDFAPGTNFLAKMDEALQGSGRTLLVLTPAALSSRYVREEWTTALQQERLVPVRVVKFDPARLLGPRSYIDLVGLDEAGARETLLEALKTPAKPDTPPLFPGPDPVPLAPVDEQPPYPGALPPVWNVPLRRNPNFTGRVDLLEDLHAALSADRPTAVTQAIAGLGGIGKTQLVVEYAYRHGHEYAGVWWWRAEAVSGLVSSTVALAETLGLPEAEAQDLSRVVEAVRRRLGQERDPWLLVFDNATEMKTLAPHLPQQQRHHVLITSRNPAWGALATVLSVRSFTRKESVAFLLQRQPSADETAAAELADDLGDLPLALEQAAAYMEQSGATLTGYRGRYRSHQTALLAKGTGGTDYPASVATTWALNVEAITSVPGASDLLRLCAYLAPDGIPRGLFPENAAALPERLATVVSAPLAFDEAVAALRHYSLVEVEGETLAVHRLVQAVTRAQADTDGPAWAEAAVALVDAAFPYQQDKPPSWAPSGALVAHALAAVAHVETAGVGLRPTSHLLNQVGLYLRSQARFAEAEPLMRRALAIDEASYGAEHPTVATSLNNLAALLQATNRLAEAEPLLRRVVLTLVEFTRGVEHEHPHLETARRHYAALLRALGRTDDEVEAELDSLNAADNGDPSVSPS